MQFEIDWCPQCEEHFVRCPRCGNNCCNAGFGTADGHVCDVCPLAYQYQELMYEWLDTALAAKPPK